MTYCVEKVCSRGLLRHWYLYPFSGNYVQLPSSVRIYVKLGVFPKGTVLCGGCWLWAWQNVISTELPDCQCFYHICQVKNVHINFIFEVIEAAQSMPMGQKLGQILLLLWVMSKCWYKIPAIWQNTYMLHQDLWETSANIKWTLYNSFLHNLYWRFIFIFRRIFIPDS